MKKITTIVALFIATSSLLAQNEVSLVVSGEGKDKNEATFNALRSAIEQVCGTFISANTNILNDRMVSDEVVSLSSGNIKSYSYVSENKQPNGNVYVTLKTTVSVDKLTTFCESKGMTAELKGGLFAMNIKKMEFDKAAEEKAIANLCKQLEEMLPTLYDYEIIVSDPQKKDRREGSSYVVDYYVKAIPNRNLYTLIKIMNQTLNSISLSNSERKEYEKIGEKVFLAGSYALACFCLGHDGIEVRPDNDYDISRIPKKDTNKINKILQSYSDWSIPVECNKDEVCCVTIRRIPFCLRSSVSKSSLEELRIKGIMELFNITIEDNIREMVIPPFNYSKNSYLYGNVKNLHYESSYREIWNVWPALNPFEKFLGKESIIIHGNISYSLEELSKITQISVSKSSNYNGNNSIKNQKNSNQSNVSKTQPQAKESPYKDIVLKALNEYNSMLKYYPNNSYEQDISHTLTQELSNEDLQWDELLILLGEIKEKTERLREQYTIDSLEYQRQNNQYQQKIDEVNEQLLQYPYNVQKQKIEDSLSISLFGKSEELAKELRTKVAALPKKKEQAEKQVYTELKNNDPQWLVTIYFTENPTQKTLADSLYLECRCKYDNRQSFDMAFIDNKLKVCDCREMEHQAYSHLFHSREEFDQSYNQHTSNYRQEIDLRQQRKQDLMQLETTLISLKQINMKKALSSTKYEIMNVVEQVNLHRNSFYYVDAITLIYRYDDRLSKEWDKNGKYFNSRTEMYEYWIGEEYDKILKEKKKNKTTNDN